MILIGGGGHASVLTDIILSQGQNILAVISPCEIESRSVFAGIRHIKEEREISEFSPEEVLCVNAIGMLPNSEQRKTIANRYRSLGYRFASVIAKSAQISQFSFLDDGVQVLQGAVIQAGAVIGAGSIVNTGAVIDHDSVLGALNHIASGARICGGVTLEDEVFVGAGATITQSVNIGRGAVVGAGAIVNKNIVSYGTIYPPKPFLRVKE